jgi:hypothetical protein
MTGNNRDESIGAGGYGMVNAEYREETDENIDPEKLEK